MFKGNLLPDLIVVRILFTSGENAATKINEYSELTEYYFLATH